jgi:dihydrofolate synthase / folylpolyglutamate synthase
LALKSTQFALLIPDLSGSVNHRVSQEAAFSCANFIRRLQSFPGSGMKDTQYMPDIAVRYQELLDYLYTFVDYSLTRNFQYTPEKFNLVRMEELLHLLGDPHRAFPIIHVAGTKGKGSTAALVASALSAAGYKVGIYTSPHLQEFTERIRLGGADLSKKEFVDLVEELKPVIARLEQPATFFELTTAMAFLHFARNQANVAVIEVGLGGRLDSTNVVTPLVSVITSLSMDHMAVLGDSLAKIAFEKAGIIKPGRPVVLSPQRDEAARVIRDVAAERGAHLTQVGSDYLFSAGEHSLEGQTFLVWRRDDQQKVNEFLEGGTNLAGGVELFTPLLGYHQVQNAATAYAALQVAREEGLAISEDAIRRGFRDVIWPGRFEILQRSPFLVIDSAHNRDSALRLRLALDDYLPGKPVVLIFGASEDKDIQGMLEELLPRVKRVIATESIHPRAAEAEGLVSVCHRYGRPAQAVLPVEKALELALEIGQKEDVAVVAAGSLFIAAAVKTAWQEQVGQQPSTER